MPPPSPKSKQTLRKQKRAEAVAILTALGFGPRQRNDTAAYTLLAMLDLAPEKEWASAAPILLGLKGINRFIAANYGRAYAENTRETIRDDAVKFFVEDGLLLRNPDDPARPTNSGKTAYQIEPTALSLIRKFGTLTWAADLQRYLGEREAIKAEIARKRTLARVPVALPDGLSVALSPGGQNPLIKAIIEQFCPAFAPGGTVLYIGDTENKFAHLKKVALEKLGAQLTGPDKMPDVIIHHTAKNWLLLIEAVTSAGPVDGKRRKELKELFASSSAGLVFVTEARFDEAFEHFNASTKAGIESLSLRRYRQFSYLAPGRAREVLAELAAERKAAPLDLELAAEELRVTYLVAPDRVALTKLKKAYLAAAKSGGSSDSGLADAEAFLESEIAHLTGDLANYAKLIARFDSPFYHFRAAFSEGRLRDAEKSLGEQTRDADAALLLYLLAVRQNDAAAAERHFQSGLALLKADGAEGRRVAALVAAERPDAAALCRAHLSLETKRILLTALGTRVAADRAAYFEMARKLNFLPEFPQQFLATILKP